MNNHQKLVEIVKEQKLHISADDLMDQVSDLCNEFLINDKVLRIVNDHESCAVYVKSDSEDEKFDYYIKAINDQPCKIGFCI